jgi:hypothetical protein
VELVQKPFGVKTLIDIIEDKDVYSELQRLNVDVDIVKAINPTHEQVIDLLERLQRAQKGRIFSCWKSGYFPYLSCKITCKDKAKRCTN